MEKTAKGEAMIYGLLLPCKILQVVDATQYGVQLPGQVEITVNLAGVVSASVTHPTEIEWIEQRLRHARRLSVWLPQPEHDRGWFLGLRPGCSFAGDIYLGKESLSGLLASKSIVVRFGASYDWRGSEWVRTWQI